MITEDYVSFETAKLLKKKGFNNPCLMYYDGYPDEPEYTSINNFYNMEEAIHYIDDPRPYITLAPTFQLTMKWLREVHNLFIEIWYNTEPEHMYCDAGIYGLGNERKTKIKDLSSPEEAAEAAIKYCLENLI